MIAAFLEIKPLLQAATDDHDGMRYHPAFLGNVAVLHMHTAHADRATRALEQQGDQIGGLTLSTLLAPNFPGEYMDAHLPLCQQALCYVPLQAADVGGLKVSCKKLAVVDCICTTIAFSAENCVAYCCCTCEI